MNGVGGRIKNPTNTIKFIKKCDIPKNRRKDVTYGSFVCNVRPEESEQKRTRFVVGGDRINYLWGGGNSNSGHAGGKVVV